MKCFIELQKLISGILWCIGFCECCVLVPEILLKKILFHTNIICNVHYDDLYIKPKVWFSYYSYQKNKTVAIIISTQTPDHLTIFHLPALASLAKWLSFHLQTRWLWSLLWNVLWRWNLLWRGNILLKMETTQ